jgi:multidrug efflux pump subunit AcrA (membrane-fusion protein)
LADELVKNPPVEATLLAVRRDLAPALTQVEIVLALPGTPTVGSTVNLTLSGPARQGFVLPHAAVLRTATGIFVYVANGTHLLRTPVQTGASDGEHIEILDGLYAGDVVAIAAVEQLWLTELRLTKGGGHSH